MFSKLTALMALFMKGQEVADPARWKARQITATILTPFLVALVAFAKSYGYEIPITNEELAQLAVGIIVLVNVVLTYATSAKVGIGGMPPDGKADGNDGSAL